MHPARSGSTHDDPADPQFRAAQFRHLVNMADDETARLSRPDCADVSGGRVAIRGHQATRKLQACETFGGAFAVDRGGGKRRACRVRLERACRPLSPAIARNEIHHRRAHPGPKAGCARNEHALSGLPVKGSHHHIQAIWIFGSRMPGRNAVRMPIAGRKEQMTKTK